jgi:predicted DNA-binding transcriptional regulator YafY
MSETKKPKPTPTKPTSLPKRAKKRSSRRKAEAGPMGRFNLLKSKLASSTAGMTVDEMVEGIGSSRSAVYRHLKELHDAGEPLEEERDGKVVRYRIHRAPARQPLMLTDSEQMALHAAASTMRAFAGTGLDDDLKSAIAKLEALVQRRDEKLARELGRMFYDVNEHPHIYDERLDDVDELVTALRHRQEVELRHKSVEGGALAYAFRPYSCILYKKGLYFAGHSGHSGAVRLIALDGVVSVTRKRDVHFECPPDYHPEKLLAGRWGIYEGPPTEVRLLFPAKVMNHVTRRRWHSAQGFVFHDDESFEMHLTVNGTVELGNWIRSWGPQVEVLSPLALRNEIAEDARKTVALYSHPRPGVHKAATEPPESIAGVEESTVSRAAGSGTTA